MSSKSYRRNADGKIEIEGLDEPVDYKGKLRISDEVFHAAIGGAPMPRMSDPDDSDDTEPSTSS